MRTPRCRFRTRCPPDAGSRETLRETRTRRDRPIPAPPTATPRRTTTPRATPSPQSGSPSEAVLRKSDAPKRRCPRKAAPRSTLPPPRATPASDAVHAERRPDRRPPERPRRASRPVRATPPGTAHCVPRITAPLGRDAPVWCVAPAYPPRRPQRPSPMRPASRPYRDTTEHPAQDRGLGKPAAHSALGIARAQRETRQKTPLR